eukprot:IDg8596t1
MAYCCSFNASIPLMCRSNGGERVRPTSNVLLNCKTGRQFLLTFCLPLSSLPCSQCVDRGNSRGVVTFTRLLLGKLPREHGSIYSDEVVYEGASFRCGTLNFFYKCDRCSQKSPSVIAVLTGIPRPARTARTYQMCCWCASRIDKDCCWGKAERLLRQNALRPSAFA